MHRFYLTGPNHLSPEEMSSKERLEELAEILATGICRLQMQQAEQLRQEVGLVRSGCRNLALVGHRQTGGSYRWQNAERPCRGQP
jgi:hypothetical protein